MICYWFSYRICARLRYMVFINFSLCREADSAAEKRAKKKRNPQAAEKRRKVLSGGVREHGAQGVWHVEHFSGW